MIKKLYDFIFSINKIKYSFDENIKFDELPYYEVSELYHFKELIENWNTYSKEFYKHMWYIFENNIIKKYIKWNDIWIEYFNRWEEITFKHIKTPN